MTKRSRVEYEQRRELQNCGWKVTQRDSVAFNAAGGGSETNRHWTAKSQVAWFLSQQGYRIDSEVTNEQETAEADIVAYGNGEPAFVVEVETGLTEDTKAKKLDQFYHNEPFCECYLLEVNGMPEDRNAQLKWVQNELGGSL